MMEMQWFGQSWGAPMCHPMNHAATPVGLTCQWCREPIDAEDSGVIFSNGPVNHFECFIRSLVGSVAHLERRCACFRGDCGESDDPRLTQREAARAAMRAWYRRFEPLTN
jgi:hypothetical protein